MGKAILGLVIGVLAVFALVHWYRMVATTMAGLQKPLGSR